MNSSINRCFVPTLLSCALLLGANSSSANSSSANPSGTSPAAIAVKPASPNASVWNAFEVNDGGFSILMPGTVDRQVNILQVEGKPVEQTLLLATQTQHDAFYMVAWSDISVDRNLTEASRAQILEHTKQSFLQSFKGKLTAESSIQLAGSTGKQFTMTSQVRGNAFTVTSRSYLIGSRLYHILAAVPQRIEPYLTGSTQGFLKSFQLRPIAPGDAPNNPTHNLTNNPANDPTNKVDS